MNKTFLNKALFYVKIITFLAAVAGVQSGVQAQDYLGADALLRKVQEQSASTNKKEETADDQARLKADLKEFGKLSTNLPPAEAAKRWLELADRAAKVARNSAGRYDSIGRPVGADELLRVLPPPATWNDLARLAAARPVEKGTGEIRNIGLRLLAAALTGDVAARKREIAALQAQAEKANERAAYFYVSIFEQLNQTLLATSDDPDAVIKMLDRSLNAAQESHQETLGVPNLMVLVGAEKTEAFLRRALMLPVALQFEEPNDTSRLAQKITMEVMAKLKAPQWGLINSLDAVSLYEALDKQFPRKTNAAPSLPEDMPDVSLPPEMMAQLQRYGRDDRGQADVYYFLGLIANNRAKDAIAVAKRVGRLDSEWLPDGGFKAMERAGYTVPLDNFFYELLSQDAGLPFWDQYVQVAAKTGQTGRMLKLVRAAVAQEDLSRKKKSGIQVRLYKALLADGQVEEGVREIRNLISLSDPADGSRGDSTGGLGMLLARLGVLLQKPEWTQEGIKVTVQWLADSAKSQKNIHWSYDSALSSLAEILSDAKRGPEAETILMEALARAARKARPESEYMWEQDRQAPEILAELALLYHKAGRSKDVLALLEKAPQWGGKDMAEAGGHCALPMPYIAASALAATGRTNEALKLTDELLNEWPGLDRGYELLLQLDSGKATARLDELFARDQFQERPLIWKAILLKKQGQLPEAEKVVRQAIAIDPSDGEQGRGDRMRAYAVLADICEARGNKKEADLFRGAVTAIRLSEDADKFYQAGLLKKAVEMYQDSLKHFADAYCIQSRLAVQLASLGLNEQAEEHYRRAYELMPDSFGRVESHCFGCEHAFDGERAQGIAEKVFTKLAAERPDKPQVHYLLGYLREAEGRYDQARLSYQEAVRLDPDYLNAWVKINSLSEHIVMPAKQRDAAAFTILRLDPLRRHAHVNYQRVGDLTGLWNAVAVAASRQPVKPESLFPLPASRVELEKKPEKGSREAMFRSMVEEMRSNRDENSPAVAVSQTPFVQFAGQLFGNEMNRLDED